LLVNKRTEKKGAIKPARGKYATYIPFFIANGTLLMDVFIFPLDKNGNASFQLKSNEEKGSCPTYWGFTSSGYLDGELWIPILRKLKERMEIIVPGIEPVLLLDNLAVHKSEAALQYCFDK
jgi:hypothetical protein